MTKEPREAGALLAIHIVRDDGVAGSNPATPIITVALTVEFYELIPPLRLEEQGETVGGEI